MNDQNISQDASDTAGTKSKRESGVAERLRLREEIAKRQVKRWARISDDDVRFEWANESPDKAHRKRREKQRERLFLGALYEYARESARLRGLLLLDSPRRKPARWERGWPVSFEGLTTCDAESRLGRNYFFLRELAGELAANEPFGSVTSPRFDAARRARRESAGRFFFYEPVVTEAEDIFLAQASTLETLLGLTEFTEGANGAVRETERKRHWLKDRNGDDCSEVLTIKVNWRDASDADLGEAFKRFAELHRPRERFPGNGARGKGGANTYSRALDCLSAMRLAAIYPLGNSSSAKNTTSAKERFAKVSLNNRIEKEDSDFLKLRREAIANFRQWFGFTPEDKPVNGETLCRQRMRWSGNAGRICDPIGNVVRQSL